jgi:hypothetical protein
VHRADWVIQIALVVPEVKVAMAPQAEPVARVAPVLMV